jgi:hypothetical protein
MRYDPFQILDVHPGASRGEIERAYELARLAYGEESLAAYSLFSPREKHAMLDRIEHAYRTITRDEGIRDAAAPRALDLENGKGHPDGNGVDRALLQSRDNGFSGMGAVDARPNGNAAPPRQYAPLPQGRLDPPVDIPGPYDGPTLRKVRDARGLTLKVVSESTKISQLNLRLIESNDSARLPAPVYLRGYLHAYARCLRLDPAEVIAGYLAQVPANGRRNGHPG